MRHDYDLPPDWHKRTPEEKSRWMTQERCRRQAMQQGTDPTPRHEAQKKRRERILKARGYAPVKDMR